MLLPLNAYRLHQMLQLVRDVKKSVNNRSVDGMAEAVHDRAQMQPSAEVLLFYKDEKADSMFYIVSGRFRLVRSGIELPVGAIVGELGMLSPSNAHPRRWNASRGCGSRLSPAPAVPKHRDAARAAGAHAAPRHRPRRQNRHDGPGAKPWPTMTASRPSLRYLFADLLGDDDDTPPFLPEACRSAQPGRERCDPSVDCVSERRLRQALSSTACGASSAGAASVRPCSATSRGWMAERMAYRDPIRIAQLKLAGFDEAARTPDRPR